MEVCGTPWYSYYVIIVRALLRGLSLTLCTPTAGLAVFLLLAKHKVYINGFLKTSFFQQAKLSVVKGVVM